MRKLALAALLLGCRPPLAVEMHSTKSWATDPSVPDAIVTRADTSVRWWGADASILDGWTIVVVDGATVCGPSTGGCTIYSEKRIYVSTDATSASCLNSLPIPHEVGHLVVGPTHDDPRWIDVKTAIPTNCEQ